MIIIIMMMLMMMMMTTATPVKVATVITFTMMMMAFVWSTDRKWSRFKVIQKTFFYTQTISLPNPTYIID